MSSSPDSTKQSSKTASKAGKELRLNRFLADCGLGSRRKVEALISAGRVTYNGTVCIDLAQKVDPYTDEIELDGKRLSAKQEKLYLLLNKPRGYVVSQSDELGRETVYSLLPENAGNMAYAGRLDKNTEGLLLFTNDTALINLLTHPSYKVEKVYKVDIDKPLRKKELDLLRNGVEIEGGITHKAGVFVNEESESSMSLKMVISEGRKRQIRQMIEAVGAKVRKLKRMQFGPLKLKDLPTGRWRYLEPGEVRALFSERNIRTPRAEKPETKDLQAVKPVPKEPRKEDVFTGDSIRREPRRKFHAEDKPPREERKPYSKPAGTSARTDKRTPRNENPAERYERKPYPKDEQNRPGGRDDTRRTFHKDEHPGREDKRDDRKPFRKDDTFPKRGAKNSPQTTYKKDESRPPRRDTRSAKPEERAAKPEKGAFKLSRPSQRTEKRTLSKGKKKN